MQAPAVQGFRSIRGHAVAVEHLRRAIARGRVASAYLFTGPQGVGKDRVALALAQVMNCTTSPLPGLPRDACGECAPCRRIASGVHPDILVLQRELKEPPAEGSPKADEYRRMRREEIPDRDLNGVIKIDQVRALITRMPFRPHEGGTRWVIVRESERFHPGAANAFLKTLEEPPEATHFVLLTHNPSMMLPTIRSRCQIVRFGPLETTDVSAVLRDVGIAPAVADDAAVPGDGSVGRALEFTDADYLSQLRERVQWLKDALNSGRPGAYVDIGDKLRGRAKDKDDERVDGRELQTILSQLQRSFRDETLARAGQNLRHAALFAVRAEIVRATMESLDSSANLNPQLAIESMLVRLREARP